MRYIKSFAEFLKKFAGARIAFSFVAVMAGFWIYTVAALPWIEPELQVRNLNAAESFDEAMAASALDTELAGILPEDSWELSEATTVESESAILLLKDYETLPNGHVRIWPCTLVFFPDREKDTAVDEKPRMLVMQAPEGAELRFDRPFSLRSVGQLVGGRLQGEVTVYGVTDAKSETFDLYARTRDVQLETSHAWTPHSVSIRWGKHQASGRELRIGFQSKDAVEENTGDLGLSDITVARDVKLHLEFESGGLFPDNYFAEKESTQNGDAELQGASSQRPEPVEISCRGPFRFDMKSRVATFEDRVDVLRFNNEGPGDQLLCERLTIEFDSQSSGSSSDTGRNDELKIGQRLPTRVLPRRVMAEGDPVVAHSPVNGATVKCQRLEYELPTQQVMVKADPAAQLEYQGSQLQSPQLKFQYQGPNRTGQWDVLGPGSVTVPAGDGRPAGFSAKWATRMQLQPNENRQLLSLLGEATVRYGEQGSLSANELWLWFREDGTGNVTEQSASTSPFGKQIGGIAPEFLVARDNVRMESLQMTADTKMLRAWFRDAGAPSDVGSEESLLSLPKAEPGISPNAVRNTPAVESYPPTAHRRVANAVHVPISTDAGDNDWENVQTRPSAVGASMKNVSETPNRHYRVQGDSVQLQMVVIGPKIELSDGAIEGAAEILQDSTPSPDEKPLQMKGDALAISGANSANMQVSIAGRPGQVRVAGLTLDGDDIRLSQGENRLVVGGPGRLTTPLEKDWQGNTLPSPSTIEVEWRREMQFNGERISFQGDVLARAEHQELRTDVVEVFLAERVSFQEIGGEMNAMAGNPDVRRINCPEPVYLKNVTSQDGSVHSVDSLQGNSLSLEPISGNVHVQGPGALTSVRQSTSNPFSLNSTSALPLPAQPNDVGNGVGLNYFHIAFQDELQGNIHDKEMSFLGGIETIFGPVSNWHERVDPKSEGGLREKDLRLTCNRLMARDFATGLQDESQIEVAAEGNTRVEGKSFTAAAGRITYALAKEMLVMEGAGGRFAQFWRHRDKGSPSLSATAERIVYWQATGETEIVGFKESRVR